MYLIVGLGNLGKKFEKTRHNLGFRVVDEFFKKNKERCFFSDFGFQKELISLVSKGKVNDEKIILSKPQTFMNNSGRAVKKIIENWEVKSENLFVVHDDLDLLLGKIKIVKNRGAAGHKGVQSIINELGTKNFVRFRIGIKPKYSCKSLIKNEKFVLQKFNKDEEKILKDVIKKTTEAIETAIRKGVERAMNEYNNK